MNLRNRVPRALPPSPPQKIGITRARSVLSGLLSEFKTESPGARPLSYGRMAEGGGREEEEEEEARLEPTKKEGGGNARNRYFGTFVSARMRTRPRRNGRGGGENRGMSEEGGNRNRKGNNVLFVPYNVPSE